MISRYTKTVTPQNSTLSSIQLKKQIMKSKNFPREGAFEQRKKPQNDYTSSRNIM